MSNHELMGEQKMQSLLALALEHSKAEQTEVGLYTGHWALTRFANSTIHQNMAGRNASMHVRAVFGKKVAVAGTNIIDEDGVRALVDQAVEMARQQDENKDFVSLPTSPEKRGSDVVESWSDKTASCSPEDRAAMVRALISESDKVNATTAGSLSANAGEHAIANSLGIRSYYRSTGVGLTTVVTGPDGGFGFAEATSSDFGAIDGRAVGEEASQTAFRSKNPADFEPGDYECVLMPYAVSDMLGMFMWMGFGALSYQEGHSFTCGKMGEKIVSESVNLWDDGHDPRMFVTPYDGEGVSKQRVDLVKNGVASGLLYDSYAAHKEGKKSTGHAGGMNLIMEPGNATVEDMISSTKRGLLVTRFHYTNVAHQMTASITGMTRDGTFLIEDGKIVRPVKNLRFTQSMLEALSDVKLIGKDLKLLGGALVPAIKVGKWRFTSSTQF